MVGIGDLFAALGFGAERRLQELEGESRGLYERREQLERVEAQLEELARDGELTPGELEQLMREVRAAGLDPAALSGLIVELRGRDGAISGDDTARFQDAVGDSIREARAGVEESLYEVRLEADRQVHTVEIGYGTAGDYNKKQHDIGMALIRNMAC